MSTKIETYSGLYIDPTNMKPEDIILGDIAHALSNQCRFSGHTSRHYSVAEHSYYVSKRLEGDRMLSLFGLLHDASEAYLVDIPAPLKHSGAFTQYLEWEEKLQSLIYFRYCGRLPTEQEHLHIKVADVAIRKGEQKMFMKAHPEIDLTEAEVHIPFWYGGGGNGPSHQERAKEMFVKRFVELT